MRAKVDSRRRCRRRCRRCGVLRPSLSSISLAGSRLFFFGEVFQHIATMRATTMMARTVADMSTKLVVVNDLLSTTEADVAVLAAPTVVATCAVVACVSFASAVAEVPAEADVRSARRLFESSATSETDDTDARDEASAACAFEICDSSDEVYAASGVGSGIVFMSGIPSTVLLRG